MNISIIKYKDVELSAIDNIVTIKGEINQESPEVFLTPFFGNVIAQMENTVILNLKELQFLNSSGIKSIITFLIKRKPGSKVIIKSDTASTWQRTSLKVLANLDSKISLE